MDVIAGAAAGACNADAATNVDVVFAPTIIAVAAANDDDVGTVDFVVTADTVVTDDASMLLLLLSQPLLLR